ncbi:MAG: alpha/beta hydrolase [Hyphomonadaceae bacterium]|nr:alpha/beta hydrolase [Hyphomonadaceae bacterium]
MRALGHKRAINNPFWICDLKHLVALIAVSLLGSFSAISAVAGERSEMLDIVYYEGADFSDEKHRLDLILPTDQAPRATLLWIHGGAWAFGDRKDDMELARAFAREGIAVANMSYRLSRGDWRGEEFSSTGVQHPEHIEDVARAFAWLHENASEYGLEVDELFVGGFSAGGHLSALLAMDDRYLRAHGLSVSEIRGALPVAGGYDLEDYYTAIAEGLGEDIAIGHVLGVFGPREGLREASPLTYLDQAEIPMLVLTEGQTADYTRVFEDAVTAQDKSSLIQFSYYDDETHASLLASLSLETSPARSEMIAFIDSVLATDRVD